MLNLIIIGLLAGVISSFFGVGGGVISVPGLYHFYPEIEPIIVISTSAGLIFLLASLNSWNFHRAGKRIDYRIVLIAGGACFITAILTSMVANLVPGKILKSILGFYYMIIAIKLIFDRPPKDEKPAELVFDNQTIFKLILTGFCGGIVAGFTGLGGGTAMVPFFILVLRLPLNLVSCYSNNTMLYAAAGNVLYSSFQKAPGDLTSLGNFLPYQLGQVNLAFIFFIFIGAMVTSKLGIKLGSMVNDKTRKNSFTIMLFVLGIKSLFF